MTISQTSNLTFRAGAKALAIIRDEGLRSERVKVVAGAAGGPKWLILSGLDRALFSTWFKNRTRSLFLMGSSIGAWRFAAVSRDNPGAAIDLFESAYIHQKYTSSPTPEEVTRESKKVMDRFLDDADVREILGHPNLRLNFMTARCRGPVASENKHIQAFGLVGAFFANFVKRRWLRFFFERSLFHHPDEIPPFFHMDEFPIRKTPLDERNLKRALLASGSIPMVMSGVNHIPGAPRGVYRDGGVIDYHLDLPFTGNEGDVVLFPHYSSRVIPGWFDKKLSWRKPETAHMDHVVLVSPSRHFLDRLPMKKIPDRNDFYLFKGRDAERIAYWNAVVREGERLGREFLDVVESGKIKKRVKPIIEKRNSKQKPRSKY